MPSKPSLALRQWVTCEKILPITKFSSGQWVLISSSIASTANGSRLSPWRKVDEIFPRFCVNGSNRGCIQTASVCPRLNLGQPLGQKPAVSFVRGQGERFAVGMRGGSPAAETAEHVCAGGGEQMVVRQFAALDK